MAVRKNSASTGHDGTNTFRDGQHSAAVGEQPTDFLLLDFGGYSDGSNTARLIESNYCAKAMALMQYDCVNLGRAEIKLPQHQLLALLKALEPVPVVSANTAFSSPNDGPDCSGSLRQRVRPFVRLHIGSNAFFITGVISSSGWAHQIAKEAGVVITSPVEALSEVLHRARAKEIVVVLANELTPAEVEAVKAFHSVNLLIGVGLDGNPLTKVPVQNVKQAALPEVLDRGREMGRADVEFMPGDEFQIQDLSRTKLLPSRSNTIIADLLSSMNEEINSAELQIQHQLENVDLKTTNEYVGSSSCSDCHQGIYQDYLSSRHALAFSTLSARKEDTNSRCLPCHTVGFGEPGGFNYERPSQIVRDVGCESCHGPGEWHIALHTGKTSDVPAKLAARLPTVGVGTCRKCHTDSTDPDFKFETMVVQINHNSVKPILVYNRVKQLSNISRDSRSKK